MSSPAAMASDELTAPLSPEVDTSGPSLEWYRPHAEDSLRGELYDFGWIVGVVPGSPHRGLDKRCVDELALYYAGNATSVVDPRRDALIDSLRRKLCRATEELREQYALIQAARRSVPRERASVASTRVPPPRSELSRSRARSRAPRRVHRSIRRARAPGGGADDSEPAPACGWRVRLAEKLLAARGAA